MTPNASLGSVLVTGGGRGIGAATSLRTAHAGYAVAVNFIKDESSAHSVVAAIAKEGGTAMAVRGDVSREDDVAAMFATIDREMPPLKGLVNNAGVVAAHSLITGIDRPRLERLFAINVFGAVFCAREAVRRMATDADHPHLVPGGNLGGVIVNVSSVAARHGGGGHFVDYAASKAAVETLTVGLAKEVAGRGIRVNAVRPGIIDTEIHASVGEPDLAHQMGPQIPLQRAGTAEEVAEAIFWLLSSSSSYTTGTIVDVSGGR